MFPLNSQITETTGYTCPVCGETFILQPRQRFCTNCGAPVGGGAAGRASESGNAMNPTPLLGFPPGSPLAPFNRQEPGGIPAAPKQQPPARDSHMPLPGKGIDLLVDCYFGTTPAREAVGMGSTRELVLSRHPDGRLQLDEFLRSGSRFPEDRVTWIVPAAAEEEAYAYIDRYGLDRFEGKTGPGAMMCGGSPKVCKFRRGDRLVRITDCNVDMDAMNVFEGVSALLSRYKELGEEVTAETFSGFPNG